MRSVLRLVLIILVCTSSQPRAKLSDCESISLDPYAINRKAVRVTSFKLFYDVRVHLRHLYALRVRFVALVRCTCPLTYSCTLSAYVYSFVYAVRVRLSIYSIVRSTLIFSGFVRSTLNFSAFVRVKMPIVRVRLYPIIALSNGLYPSCRHCPS